MRVKNMRGHSGCQIWLHEDNGSKFVRKTSSSEKYNPRLMRQMNKQKDFKSEILKSPKILNQGMEGPLFFFDMEFIGGTPFYNYIEYNTINTIWPIFEKLIGFMENKNVYPLNAESIVVKKVECLNGIVGDNFKKYCDYCLDFDWSNVKGCYSHGDLTFENIIINGSDVYLIDFLDSFLNIKETDYSKALQDILLRWSWRRQNKAPLIKNIMLYDRITENMSCQDINLSIRLLVLNLLRIIPYANNSTLPFLKESLRYLEERFNIWEEK